MTRAFLGRTWRAQAFKLVIVAATLAIWGALMPVVYHAFGEQFKSLFASGVIPSQFAQFGGGDVFSLSGAIALGFVHPLAVILACVFAVGFTTAAIAGERQRGTLEVLLARPIGRNAVYLVLLGSVAAFLALVFAAGIAGTLATAAAQGLIGEVRLNEVPWLWFNATLLYVAIGALGLAASVTFDRLGPAIGITLAVTIVAYFLDVLGSLWPDAKGLEPWSLFHHLDAKAILTGHGDPFDLLLLGAVTLACVAYALWVFPRRDLAAPS